MSVSIAIALMALPALNEEKWIKSFLIIIIAASMQISAAILIPVWIVVLSSNTAIIPSADHSFYALDLQLPFF
jgi:ABC-type dipeptide/oligopeptide/nickel transport system permease component